MSRVTCHVSRVTCHMSHVTCHVSHIFFIFIFFTIPPPLCVMCHVSHVTCHMSRVTCHVSHVMCHMSRVTFFFFLQSPPQKKYWSYDLHRSRDSVSPVCRIFFYWIFYSLFIYFFLSKTWRFFTFR